MQEKWFQDAGRCFECQRTLPPDEPAFRVQALNYLALVWVCNDCVIKLCAYRQERFNQLLDREHAARLRNARWSDLLDVDVPPAEICRVCGREMYVLEEQTTSDWANVRGEQFHDEGPRHDYARFQDHCSERCRLKLITTARREVRHEKASSSCAHCGKSLDGLRRSDTRYCCALCRTHALRTRRRAEPGYYKTKEEIRQAQLKRGEQKRIDRLTEISKETE